jgi:predicted GIY-YIG superfamily endonuclease
MKTDNIGEIYIIHLHTKLGHAQHYVGFTTNYSGRMFHHRNNTGSHFLRVCNELRIKWTPVLKFAGTRTDERRLKNTNNTSRYCPVCRVNAHKFKTSVLPHERTYEILD